jgi:hypothetical protein
MMTIDMSIFVKTLVLSFLGVSYITCFIFSLVSVTSHDCFFFGVHIWIDDNRSTYMDG